MPDREISPGTLIARLKALLRRHGELDATIDNEQMRPWADPERLKQLKRERLGLRDAIRRTQSKLRHAGARKSYLN